MKKKLAACLAAAVLACSLSIPAFATAPTATPEPTSAPVGVGREDLEGSEGVVEDAVGLLDTIYEYLPELRPGVVAFMTAARYTFPSWFSMAFLLSLILIVFKVFLRFMWR